MNWQSEQFVCEGDVCMFEKPSRTVSIARKLFTFKENWNLSNQGRPSRWVAPCKTKTRDPSEH